MGTKEYGQYCPMALALERLGERWTLLIVRDLLAGPRRYSDLQTGLPGIGTNILASRLKGLVEMGLVEKRELPPPAASTVYELTAAGRGLGPTLIELGRWGMQFLPEQDFDPAQIAEALRSRYFLVLDRNPRAEYTIALGFEDQPVTVELGPGRYEVEEGSPADASVRMKGTAVVFTELLMLGRPVAEAAAAGDLLVEGDIAAAEEFVRCVQLVEDEDAEADEAPRLAAVEG